MYVLIFSFRKEKFQIYLNERGLQYIRFVRHCSVRWLTFKPALQIIANNFDCLKTYFSDYLPSTEIKMYGKIRDGFQIENVQLKMEVLLEAGRLFERPLELLQGKKPLIHKVYLQLSHIFKNLTNKTCLRPYNDNIPVRATTFSTQNLKRYVTRWPELRTKLREDPMAVKDKIRFLGYCGKWFAEIATYLEKKCRTVMQTLKHFQCLDPAYINKPETVGYLRALLNIFPTPNNLNAEIVITEFQQLQSENINIENYGFTQEGFRIDVFWNRILRKENRSYPNLEFFIINMMTVSHGQADVERQFSISGNYMTKDKAQINIETYKAALYCIDAVKQNQNKAHLIAIDDELIKETRQARAKYGESDEQRAEKQILEEARSAEVTVKKERVQQLNQRIIQAYLDLDTLENSSDDLRGTFESNLNQEIDSNGFDRQLFNLSNSRSMLTARLTRYYTLKGQLTEIQDEKHKITCEILDLVYKKTKVASTS